MLNLIGKASASGRRVGRLVGGALVATVASTLAASQPAMAADSQVLVSTPMHTAGWVTGVREAADPGELVVSTSDGRQLTLPDTAELRELGRAAAQRGAAQAAPDNYVAGNCGTSWIFMNSTLSTSKVWFHTGFLLYGLGRAVAYYWLVHVRGPAFAKNPSKAGGLASRQRWDWIPEWSAEVRYRGIYAGYVSTASDAILANGAVCVSGGPSSATIL